MLVRKKRHSVKKKGIFDFNIKGFKIYWSLAAIAGIIVTLFLTGALKTFLSTFAVNEAIEFNGSVSEFKIKGAQKGAGYVSAKDGTTRLNAEILDIYNQSRPDLQGTGASSYFCSNIPLYGCDLRYYFSTGANDDTWSMFIDASKALANMDTKEKENFETQIIKGYQDAGFSPIVDHSATAVSAITTSVSANATNDGDGIFEIGNL